MNAIKITDDKIRISCFRSTDFASSVSQGAYLSPMRKSIGKVLILLFTFLLSCATTGQIRKYTQGSIIDRGSFSVIGPLGDGWFVVIKKVIIEFTRRNVHSGSDKIEIMAVRNDDKKKEEEIALKFISRHEENLMKNVKSGRCVLNDMKKDTTSICNKNIYFITSLTSGWIEGLERRADAFYILFPADFKERNRFFIFWLIQLGKEEGFLEAADIGLIVPVIDSLKIK